MNTGHWVRLTLCANIPLREGRAVRIEDYEIAIFNLGDRFLATENRCPHRGGPLADGIISGEKVVCPLHARTVCLNTGQMPAAGEQGPLCVKTYPTRIVDGYVDLKIPASASASAEIILRPGRISAEALESGAC